MIKLFSIGVLRNKRVTNTPFYFIMYFEARFFCRKLETTLTTSLFGESFSFQRPAKSHPNTSRLPEDKI
jgi:hypothetical protein